MQTPAELLQDFQALIRSSEHVLARGGGSKPALSTPAQGWHVAEIARLSGVLEYQPDEFTFTAYAGTRLSQVEAMLDEHGQYLPFDPLWVARGATLGGAVAANTAGPRRHRYGGVRDFLIGVTLLDGNGELIRGGGKVVKNSAGFDLPKLMVGSLGAFGVMLELSFKIFPRPQAAVTLHTACATLEAATSLLQRLSEARLDLEAVDLAPAAGWYDVWVHLTGLQSALASRLERLQRLVVADGVLAGDEDANFWRQARELAWVPPDHAVVRVGLTPGRIKALEAALRDRIILRHYAAGGQLVWLATQEPLAGLNRILADLGLGGTVLQGAPGRVRLGCPPDGAFYRRVKQALDPHGRFVEG